MASEVEETLKRLVAHKVKLSKEILRQIIFTIFLGNFVDNFNL